MTRRSYMNGIILEDMDAGILVRQYDEAYVARRWRLTQDVEDLVQTALDAGMRWMIRDGHPQPHARWPSEKGRVYLAFSPTRENQWSLAIDQFNARTGRFGFGVFNGKYRSQFEAAGVPFEFEKRNRGAGHMVVKRDHLLETLRKLSGMDHSVLYRARDAAPVVGFTTEYDIQRAMILGWCDTPFGSTAKLIGDEVPVDLGANPRRIDLLAHDPMTRHLLIIEIKRAEAHMAALDQVRSYVASLSTRPEYAGHTISGVLIAERVPEHLRTAARDAGIVTFEIAWPRQFTQVA